MKKLVFILLPLVMDFVDAKYCAYEVNGETRFYTCPRTEYCCNFGCCVSPAFQFYQLWYYWLLVIFMFLLCSGGGWWYRCWLRGRFPETQTSINRTSAIPTTANQQHRRSALLRTTRSIPATPAPPPTEAVVGPPGQNQFQVARVSYSTSGDRLILHRLWKDSRGGLHHMDSPPSYSTAHADTQPLSIPAAASAAVLMNPYVLYGPPPSYEAVMQEDQAGPSGTQTEVSPPHESESLSPEDEDDEGPSIESCPSSQQVSPVSPCSPIEETSPTSPTSPNLDIVTSDEERGPETSHQASQTVFSPVSSPTSL